jgi:hypothetical protein
LAPAFPENGFSHNFLKVLGFIVLFVFTGVLMDFIHEVGHVLWGTLVGGQLRYFQLTFFTFYPQVGLAQSFELGCVVMGGFASDFNYGLFMLGGSMTTNVAAWLLSLVLLSSRFGKKIRWPIKLLALFGVLDLPFYVVLPQLGLHHWIILGGLTPEPLVGARFMGVPDTVFYVLVFLSTLDLFLLNFLAHQRGKRAVRR